MPLILSAVLGLLLSLVFVYFPFISFSLASIPAVYFVFKKRYLYGFFALIICLLGIFYGIFHTEVNNKNEKVVEFQGYILDKKDNIYFLKSSKGEVFKFYYENELKNDRFYKIVCKISPEHRNPYTVVSNTRFCYVQHITDLGQLKLNFIQKIQQKINEELKSKLNQNTSNVLVAMTTGHRYSISKEIQTDFQKTGLIHLLSISGAHFSLLFTASFLFFRFLLKRLPYKILVAITLYIKPSQLSILLCFPVVLIYFLIVEPNYPSTRAFIMSMLFMFGVLTERKSLWIITVSIACLIILLLEPNSAGDLSFQLSFLATIGIGFASDVYKKSKYKIPVKVLSYIFLSLIISISATLITAPLIVYRFHYLSLISPLSNLTAGLLIGMILFPLNILFIAIYFITGTYPFPELIIFIASASFRLMHLLASLKFSSVNISAIPIGSVVLFYLAIFLAIFNFYLLKGFSKKIIYCISSVTIVAGILISIFLTKGDNTLKVTFIDVGQAEATMIETPQGVFLIDTGRTGFEAERFLKAKNVKDLQALIITHEQKDHAGGFERIIESFNVREIWDNGYIAYSKDFNALIRHLKRGDVLKIGDCSFTVLHPYEGFWTSSLSRDSNEVGLVFKFKCFKYNYLFTSDTGVSALQSIPVNYLKSEVIKIPHHGSKYSFYPEFYKATKPCICIISAGKGNPYGHPHKEVVEDIEKICKIYRTDEDGAIQIKESPEGVIKIQSFKSSMFEPYKELSNLEKLFVLW